METLNLREAISGGFNLSDGRKNHLAHFKTKAEAISWCKENGYRCYVWDEAKTYSHTFDGAKGACPYCLKTLAFERGAMPDHKTAIGEPCDGAGRRVVSMDAGRAVLMGWEDRKSADDLKVGDILSTIGGPDQIVAFRPYTGPLSDIVLKIAVLASGRAMSIERGGSYEIARR